MSDIDCNLAVIGGGILGLATAYIYQKKHPDKVVFIFEKESAVATHQTGNNSGVIHSGLYYKPGSKKAKLCVRGRQLLIDFAQQHNVPFEICGKIIVATERKDIPQLEKIYKNGLKNNCENIQFINPEKIKEIEPYCSGIKGIWVPSTGIIDFVKFSQALASEIIKINPNSKVLFNHFVKDLKQADGVSKIATNDKMYTAEISVSCAGLQADKVAINDAQGSKIKVVPFRGDYYELTEAGKSKVKNLIYPVPDSDFPFLGVHFTRMLNGEIECGPNAVFSFKREGYKKCSFSLQDTYDALTFVGLWRFLGKHWRQAFKEYHRSLSKKKFLQSLRKLIPSLKLEDIQPSRSGVRAQAMDSKGDLIYDISIVRKGNHSHVLNAPSPAATACLAIGEYVVETIQKKE
jgi:L-2-hydroxyglutarate oxidase